MKREILGTLFAWAIAALSTPAQAAVTTVVGAQTVLNREFGVDLHLDNCCSGNYANIPNVISQITYIGATRVRDWATTDAVLANWRLVYAGTGDTFHASIPEASPAGQTAALTRITAWLKSNPGMIDTIEGGNEEDDHYPLSQGASLAQSVTMQPKVYAAGHAAGVTVDQLTVGANWFPPLYNGDYENFGKPPADQGNAHVYMNANSPPMVSLTRIGALAAYSVPGKPVDVTEFGIYLALGQTDAITSSYMHEAPFDAYLLGYSGLFIYALHDDSSGASGFYTVQGYKRPIADYWHYTTQLLSDPKGKLLPPKTLALTFAGKAAGIAPYGLKNLPMYKSDGSLWIAAYDEEHVGAEDGSETIKLDRTYNLVKVWDGRTGALVAQYPSSASIQLPLPCNHVYLVDAK